MKRFRAASITFISVISVIFGCNIYFLVSLYNSIRADVEREVMAAFAIADVDDLWARAEAARQAHIKAGQELHRGEISAAKDIEHGELVTSTQMPGGTEVSERQSLDGSSSFTSDLLASISRQFHSVMDPYVPYNLPQLDSLFMLRLAERGINVDEIAVEVVDSLGTIVVSNPRARSMHHCDTFMLPLGVGGYEYRALITPLTWHIARQMAGVGITLLLLGLAFTAAFTYLIHTVNQMRDIERMKDDLVNNMTHELKTPIAIAYSANDALLNFDTAADPVRRASYLGIANRQLKRLGALVESILAMSMERRNSLVMKMESIDLIPFVREIAAAQYMRKEKVITIDVDCPEGEIIIVADKTHLANIINNLLDNAIKYSGDRVSIKVVCTPDGISVSDDGIGIPASSIPYLFDRFYRVPQGNTQNVRGYGIGLYYVKSITDKLGWDISVRSCPGEGTVFTIKFNYRNES